MSADAAAGAEKPWGPGHPIYDAVIVGLDIDRRGIPIANQSLEIAITALRTAAAARPAVLGRNMAPVIALIEGFKDREWPSR